jgi:hypothetical protein
MPSHQDWLNVRDAVTSAWKRQGTLRLPIGPVFAGSGLMVSTLGRRKLVRLLPGNFVDEPHDILEQ